MNAVCINHSYNFCLLYTSLDSKNYIPFSYRKNVSTPVYMQCMDLIYNICTLYVVCQMVLYYVFVCIVF